MCACVGRQPSCLSFHMLSYPADTRGTESIHFCYSISWHLIRILLLQDGFQPWRATDLAASLVDFHIRLGHGSGWRRRAFGRSGGRVSSWKKGCPSRFFRPPGFAKDPGFHKSYAMFCGSLWFIDTWKAFDGMIYSHNSN